jgi:hypothetical protein
MIMCRAGERAAGEVGDEAEVVEADAARAIVTGHAVVARQDDARQAELGVGVADAAAHARGRVGREGNEAQHHVAVFEERAAAVDGCVQRDGRVDHLGVAADDVETAAGLRGRVVADRGLLDQQRTARADLDHAAAVGRFVLDHGRASDRHYARA